MDGNELVAQLSLEEKAALCSGGDFWHTKGIERLGITPLMLTDGPHGLRKQAGDADHLGINVSVPATCFPLSCATAGSFDEDLLREIGVALGEECLQEQVAVILGPGANIKRNPLCGRNFEYFSEDPYLTGRMAAAIISGIQSKGIGTSLKHYAANSQERLRMTSNSVVDERALREIYLSGFEMAVKHSQPWTLMCSYNMLNGTYASENKWLLSDVLRDEWGFTGLVMSDWGAVNERVAGVKAGLDLEMPASNGINDARIVAAVRAGELSETELDRVAVRVADMILKGMAESVTGYRYDVDAHHALARRAAAASCVLLKNCDNVLPLQPDVKVALIGAFAKTPRYQGAGSSKINPTRIDNAFDTLLDMGYDVAYEPGYSLTLDAESSDALIKDAQRLAATKDVAIIFAGLPDEYESEGFDRENLAMPEKQNRLIAAVAAANPNTIVVLQLGAPVELPWASQVKAILVSYLGGQAGSSAAVDVLVGAAEPGGRLAETWPVCLADVPSPPPYYPALGLSAEYRESIFVGYRYYDKTEVAPAYPFGYGLSYTTFEYDGFNLELSAPDTTATEVSVSFTVTNTGTRPGSEVAQVYVGLSAESAAASTVFRPVRELKGFTKLQLQPGESQKVSVKLDARAFSYYNVAAKQWAIETGTYVVSVGASSSDIRLSGTVNIIGDGLQSQLASLRDCAPEYYNLRKGEPLKISGASFAAAYGSPLPPTKRAPGTPYTANSTLSDIKDKLIGKLLLSQVRKNAAQMLDGSDESIVRMMEAALLEMPLRSLVTMSNGQLSIQQLTGILDMLNGKPLQGIRSLLRK
ncbi:MAG: glycoside hydrolase family 3 C-terminal domain-containing protein [Propionibacteriaceae bacterium]|jgi:beta-glucosidase|nr:glycoside hydrolase family 3 C-terminal domain-containing protein [Propionibacteriaceae bacterium]